MKPKNSKDLYTNEDIVKEAGLSYDTMVRTIAENGDQLGMLSLRTAIETAYDSGVDLVLMSNQPPCPVCKIMDYGKFCFVRDKKEKEAKKKQIKVDIKEIQLSVLIDVGDFNTKANQANKFLTSGNKVKVIVKFRGRQMAHTEIGGELLDRFFALCSENGIIEKKPVLDGRNMIMFIAPKPAK